MNRIFIDVALSTLFILFIICSFYYCEAGVIRNRHSKDSIITKYIVSPWKPNNYKFEYETSMGISRREVGVLKKASNGKHYLEMVGFYRYKAPDEKIYHVDYTADEKGFRPLVKIFDKDGGIEKTTINDDDNIHFPEDTSTMAPISRSNLRVEALSQDDENPLTDLKESNEGLGNRFGLPPGVVGSLLG